MSKVRFRSALQFREDPAGEDLSELDAPLIERIDLPDGALSEHRVLVEGNEFAEGGGGEALAEDGVGRSIALKNAVRDEPFGHAFAMHLFGGLAEGQGLGLGQHIRDQDVVMGADGMQRLGERDEVAWDELRSLMDQLVKRVLAVRAGLAPVDRASLVVRVPSSVTCFPLDSMVSCWR